ncbi:DUF3999 family protein [Phosphitispora sp. TUW77]|uniref:DUF3999 family protein n=1 Tax=Phosphitispora sp. TUW77 TaxID=3152361 RepID=UPI003AB68297
MKCRSLIFLNMILTAAILATTIYSTMAAPVEAAATASVEAAFAPDMWQKYCLIEQGDTAKGYALIELTPAIYSLASSDLRDLRAAALKDGRIEELPYDVVSYGQTIVQKSPVAVINRGVNKTKSTATVFLGENAGLHNHLEIRTADKDFIKQAAIEGSDDGVDWVQLDSSGTIADVTAYGDGFRRTGVNYSQTNYRFLRITLTGAGDPVSIEGVDILFKNQQKAVERSIKLQVVSLKTIKKSKAESIILTSGFNNLKLHSLEFSVVEPADFSRDVSVFVSQDKENWVFAGEGKLEMLSLPQSKQPNLILPIDSQGYPYFEVLISNGDNPPLKISEVKGSYTPDYVLFPCQKKDSFRLYLSNKSANAPKYDLVNLSKKIMAASPPVWHITNPKDNPSYKAAPVPESEQHNWLLPGILAIMAAALAFLIIKSLPHVMKR